MEADKKKSNIFSRFQKTNNRILVGIGSFMTIASVPMVYLDFFLKLHYLIIIIMSVFFLLKSKSKRIAILHALIPSYLFLFSIAWVIGIKAIGFYKNYNGSNFPVPDLVIKKLKLRNDTLYNVNSQTLDSLYDNGSFTTIDILNFSGIADSITSCSDLMTKIRLKNWEVQTLIDHEKLELQRIDCDLWQLALKINLDSNCSISENFLFNTERIPSSILIKYAYDRSTNQQEKLNHRMLSMYESVKMSKGDINLRKVLEVKKDGYIYKLKELFSSDFNNDGSCDSVIYIESGPESGMDKFYDIVVLSDSKGENSLYEIIKI